MSATAGGRRRDDVRLVLYVGMVVCFIPLRNAYAERCVCVGARPDKVRDVEREVKGTTDERR